MFEFNNSLVVLSLFSFSLLEKAVSSLWFTWLFAKGLKILTSKNARSSLCLKPRAMISKQTSSEEMVLLVKTSPVKVWRCRSTSKSWHSSMRRDANGSLSWSCLLWTNPSFIQYIAWSTSNLLLQVDVDGRWLQCPAVPKAERIVEFLFFRSKFSDVNGNVVNQLKAPFIFARSFALSCSGLIFSQSCCRMVLFTSPLLLAILLPEILICSLSTGAMLSCLLICSNSCSPAAQELANSRLAMAEKIGFVNPPF